MEFGILMQIVDFYPSNSGGVVDAAHDRGVVARWQLGDNCRLPWIARSVAAVHNIADLVPGNDPVTGGGGLLPTVSLRVRSRVESWN